MIGTLFMPWVTLWIIWEDLNAFQICMIAAYTRTFVEIIYRLYRWISGEILLYYIANFVIDDENPNIEGVFEYYKWIKQDIGLIKDVLIEYFGNDVAAIVLSYTPDYLQIYEQIQKDKANRVEVSCVDSLETQHMKTRTETNS